MKILRREAKNIRESREVIFLKDSNRAHANVFIGGMGNAIIGIKKDNYGEIDEYKQELI